MRRGGRMRGRGRGRGQPPRHIEQRPAPFVAQEIESIDMELQLLKKKREMIEQHKNILKNQIKHSQQKQYDTEKPRHYKQNTYDPPGLVRSNRDFARYYDNPGEEDYIPLSSGSMRHANDSWQRGTDRKRPADGSWPRGSGAKRNSSRGGSVVQSFGSRLGPKPVPQSPVPQPGPSWIPVANASKRITIDPVPPAALPKRNPRKKSACKDPEEYTLRAGYEPSTVLNGLFELGVGFILKQMKQMYGNSQKYNRVVTRDYYTRRLKKTVRSRIRKIMVNKRVDNYVDVVDEYRRNFPLKTDEELVEKAFSGEVWEPPTGNEPGFTMNPSTEAPRAGMPCPNFFKSRMRRYVGAKLRSTFSEIVEMYNPVEESSGSAVDSSGDVIMAEANAKTGQDNKTTPKNPKWKLNIADLINERLGPVMQDYIPTITKILNMDPEYIRTKASLLVTTLNMDPSFSGKVEIDNLEEPEVTEIHEESKPIQYYAKVCGRPNIPQQRLMRPFLFKFKPTSVKKHKKSKNLLYVMFMDKDSFDKFLSQDGVTIGNSTLDIKVSGNPIQAQNNENENINTGGDTQIAIESKEKEVTPVSTEMEGQIIDLLSSIRRGEEQASTNEENVSVSEDTTEEEKRNEPQIESIDNNSIEITNESDEQNHEENKPHDEQNDQTAKNDNSKLNDNSLQASHTDSTVENNVGVSDDATKDLCAVDEQTQSNDIKDEGITHGNTTDEKIPNQNETT